MIYSHRGREPAPLPHRIRLADGSTRTDAATFTPEELASAGYSGPHERPACDPRSQTVAWDGTAYLVRPYSESETSAQWAAVRQQRNALLQASDWTQLEDYDLGADRAAWAAYRQALRDLPDQPNPFDLSWPEPPAEPPAET